MIDKIQNVIYAHDICCLKSTYVDTVERLVRDNNLKIPKKRGN